MRKPKGEKRAEGETRFAGNREDEDRAGHSAVTCLLLPNGD